MTRVDKNKDDYFLTSIIILDKNDWHKLVLMLREIHVAVFLFGARARARHTSFAKEQDAEWRHGGNERCYSWSDGQWLLNEECSELSDEMKMAAVLQIWFVSSHSSMTTADAARAARLSTLKQNADFLVQRGKGILAADESPASIVKRLQSIGLENTPEQRRIYRQILFSTSNIQQYISGIIMHEETFNQSNDSSLPFPTLLTQLGILPGVRLDRVTSTKCVWTCPFDTTVLSRRVWSHWQRTRAKWRHSASMIWISAAMSCKWNRTQKKIASLEYSVKQGALFAKWRCALRIDTDQKQPTDVAILNNAIILARYASICQSKGTIESTFALP